MRQGDIFSSGCRWGSPAQHRHGSPMAAHAARHGLGHLRVHSQVLTGFNGMLPAHFLSLRHHLPGQLTPPQLHMASHHHCQGHPARQQWCGGVESMSATHTPLPLSPSFPKRLHPCNPSQSRDATQHPMAGSSQHAPGDANLTLGSTLAWKKRGKSNFCPSPQMLF